MKKLLICLLLLASANIFAQSQFQFQYEAPLPKIDSSTFYNIYLPPVITSKLNYKFSDIRIYNSNGKEIPYIRDTESNRIKTAKRTRLKIIQNEHKPAKRYTVVLIHNPRQINISDLAFIIKNTDAQIWLNISGSNDLKNWDILKNNVQYQHQLSDSATAVLLINDLPQTNYQYYRVIFYDYNRTPIVIYDAYTFFIQHKKLQYVQVPNPKIYQNDTSLINKTILKIVFPTPQYIDKIQFFISSPKFYLRKAVLTAKDTTTGRRVKLKYYYQNQKDFYLCSDSSNTLRLSRYYAKELYLIVENNNNQPLKFSGVKAYQIKEFLIAPLNKNEKYVLKFGNKNVPAPIYDLTYFINKIPKKRPTIIPTKIIKLTSYTKNIKKFYIKPAYFWFALSFIVVLMIIISILIFRKYKFNDIV